LNDDDSDIINTSVGGLQVNLFKNDAEEKLSQKGKTGGSNSRQEAGPAGHQVGANGSRKEQRKTNDKDPSQIDRGSAIESKKLETIGQQMAANGGK